MNEIENKIKEMKKALKPFDIFSAIGLIIAVIGAVLLIVGVAMKKDSTSDAIFCAGIGSFASAAIFVLSILVVARKQYDEYYRLKKELKKTK